MFGEKTGKRILPHECFGLPSCSDCQPGGRHLLYFTILAADSFFQALKRSKRRFCDGRKTVGCSSASVGYGGVQDQGTRGPPWQLPTRRTQRSGAGHAVKIFCTVRLLPTWFG